MKKTLLFTNIFVVILSLGLMCGCQSTPVGPGAESQKENLLVRAGFKAKTVTTPKQQQRVSALPPGQVSTVGYKGKLYYVYPTATKDRILVGNQTQYLQLENEIRSSLLIVSARLRYPPHLQ